MQLVACVLVFMAIIMLSMMLAAVCNVSIWDFPPATFRSLSKAAFLPSIRRRWAAAVSLL